LRCDAYARSRADRSGLGRVGVPHLDTSVELALTEIEDREELVCGPVDAYLEQVPQASDSIL
jgi:hypothetical protein